MESPSRLCSNCGSIHVADSCCVLHCESSDGTVVPFVDHTLDKCRTVLSIRKVKNRKYKEVVLPENVNNKKTRYHAEYYRKFTALGRNAAPQNDDVEPKPLHTRSKSTLASGSSSTGIMPKICIFCTKKEKKHSDSKQKLVLVKMGDFEKKIKKYATTLGDQELLSKLGSIDFVAKEIRYHRICRTKYQTAAEQVSKTSQNKEAAKCSINNWHRGREIHSEAFKSICSLVEDQVITGGDMLGLKDSFNNYVLIIEDLDTENLAESYTAQRLEEKLKLHFKERIIIHNRKYKRSGSFIYNSNIIYNSLLIFKSYH